MGMIGKDRGLRAARRALGARTDTVTERPRDRQALRTGRRTATLGEDLAAFERERRARLVQSA